MVLKSICICIWSVSVKNSAEKVLGQKYYSLEWSREEAVHSIEWSRDEAKNSLEWSRDKTINFLEWSKYNFFVPKRKVPETIGK